MQEVPDTSTDWRARAEAAETRLAELRADNARLWDEVSRLKAERREVEYFERHAAHMEGSLSWQITAPLRQAKTLAILVRRKLDERES